MGIFDIIGAAILLAILIGCCLCCSKVCQRKKRPDSRRKRRRQQKNARRKRRRQQRNCPGQHPPPPPPTTTNPQTRIQISNPPPQQQPQTNASRVPGPPPGYQTISPNQHPNPSSQTVLQFHNQQYSNPLLQSPQGQQLAFAQQQLPHIVAAQPADLYPFPPPPYEPPEQVTSQRQLETRITIPGVDISQFARPPPPPYDEELQRSEPFRLN